MALSVGQTLEDRYQISALLGQGGMGAVYHGVDLRFNAPVAIKENRLATAESQNQFAREASILYRLRHPNLARVIDHFSIPGQGQYLVMDYVEGHDLKQLIHEYGPVPQEQALGWFSQVLAALAYLHSQQIIHRDVKPANVKITPKAHVFLVDFGLAKLYDPSQRTTIGARGVTPGYAPPEQYGQGRTDARSDIYSAAATLYAMLTGFAPPDALETMTRQTQFVPPRQINPSISPQVEAAILKAMQPAPDDRWQTVLALRAALFEPPTRPVGRPAPAQQTPGPKMPPQTRPAVQPPAEPATRVRAAGTPPAKPASQPPPSGRPPARPAPGAQPAPGSRPPAPAAQPAPGSRPPAPAAAQARPPAAGPTAQYQPRPQPARASGPPPPAPAAVPQAQSIRWRRVVILASIAGVLGILAALIEGESAPLLLGHWIVAAMVVGLIIYHTLRVLRYRMRQFQVEVLSLWLAVTLTYQITLTLLGLNEVGQLVWPFVGLGFFWLPSALTGALVLWIARKVKLGKK